VSFITSPWGVWAFPVVSEPEAPSPGVADSSVQENCEAGVEKLRAVLHEHIGINGQKSNYRALLATVDT
jgi:hypothetical protein